MHPIAFELGSRTVAWYSLLFACGIVACLMLAAWRAWRGDVPLRHVLDIARYAILSGLLGAKLTFVLTDWPAEGIASLGQGWVFYGGMLLAAAAVYGAAKARGINPWSMLDFASSAVPLGHAIGRTGCLLAGCCYGVSCDLPWAVHFPPTHPTFGAPVHPTQLYEVAGNLLLLAILGALLPRRRFPGQVFVSYLLGYGLLRFFVEFMRADNPRHWPGDLTDSQIVALGSIAVAVLLYGSLSRTGSGSVFEKRGS